jgi:hypothetical protein
MNFETLKEAFYNNGSYKVVALLITLILWITVLGNKDQILNQNVQLSFLLPENHVFSNAVTNQVQIQVSGSRLSLKKLSKGIAPIQINLSDIKAGRTIVSIPTDSIDLPFGSQIVNVNPASIVVDIDRVITKRIPIKFQWDTEEPDDIMIRDIQPRTVVVKGALSVLSRVQEVLTDPISPAQLDFDTKKRIDLRVGLREFNFFGILPFDTKAVTVTLEKK